MISNHRAFVFYRRGERWSLGLFNFKLTEVRNTVFIKFNIKATLNN